MKEKDPVTTANKPGRLLYIDGLKGIACVMIMLCHYFAVVKDAQGITQFPALLWLYGSAFHTVIDENFWLQLFFVVSGFLVSYSVVPDIKSLIKRMIKRFLRFYLPILAACILIYLLAATVGFHNKEITGDFAGQWFGIFYGKSFVPKDLLTDPLKTVLSIGSKFNAPYWVIANMFYSSVIIYIISFITEKTGCRGICTAVIYLTVIFAAGILISPIISACLAGGLCGNVIRDCRERISGIPAAANTAVCILCIILPLGLHSAVYRALAGAFSSEGTLPGVLRILGFRNDIWGVIYLALLIIMLSCNENIQKLFSGRVLRQLNDIGFGIYSFHWPLICSAGALIMISIPAKHGVILAWTVCAALTIAASIPYHIVIEKNINRFLRKL